MMARRPARVLMTTDAVGGVWQFSLDLARGLGAAGIRVRLAVLGPAPSQVQMAEAAAIPGASLAVTNLPLDWTTPSEQTLTDAAQALASLAAAEAPDLVHLNHPAFAEAPWTAPVLSIVHSCHGSWWAAMRGDAPPPPDFRWRAARMRRALACSDRAVAPSAALAAELDRLYRPPRPIAVVRNGRTPAALPTAQAPRRNYVFAAGRLWDQAKNAAALDAAAASIAAPVIAAGPAEGPNGERAAFRHLALAGNLDAAAMAAHYRAARAFVSTARYEPFGLAVLEAAQAGCPLVLSDIPTFRELWDGAALFAPPDDPAAIARQCNRLLADPAEAAARSARAAARAADYTVARMIDGYLAEYAAILAPQLQRQAG